MDDQPNSRTSVTVNIHAEPDASVRDFTHTPSCFTSIELGSSGNHVAIMISALATVDALEAALAEVRTLLTAAAER